MAGFIDPNINLNLSARSNVVTEPFDTALRTVFTEQQATNRNDKTNFQTGLNNVIQQAAQNYRKERQDQAQRELAEFQKLAAIEAANKKAILDRQNELEKEKRAEERVYTAPDKIAADIASGVKNLKEAGFSGEQLARGTQALIKQYSTKIPSGPSKEYANFLLGEYDALQNPEMQQPVISENPQASMVSESIVPPQQFQAADGSTLMADEMGPMNQMGQPFKISGGLSAQAPVVDEDNVFNQIMKQQRKEQALADLEFDKANAESKKAVNELKAVEQDIKTKEATVASIKDLSNLADNEAEKFVFSDIADSVDEVLSNKDSAKKYVEAKQVYLDPKTTATVKSAITISKELESILKEVQASGATLGSFDENLKQSIYAKFLEGDTAGANAVLDSMFAKGMIGNRGSLTPKQADELSRKLFSAYKRLTLPMVAVSKTIYGNTGALSDRDVRIALDSAYQIGNDVENNLRSQKLFQGQINGSLILSDAYFGRTDRAAKGYREFKESGFSFDEFGGIKAGISVTDYTSPTNNSDFISSTPLPPDAAPAEQLSNYDAVDVNSDDSWNSFLTNMNDKQKSLYEQALKLIP